MHPRGGVHARGPDLPRQVWRVQGGAAVHPADAEGAGADRPHQDHGRAGVEEGGRQELQPGEARLGSMVKKKKTGPNHVNFFEITFQTAC